MKLNKIVESRVNKELELKVLEGKLEEDYLSKKEEYISLKNNPITQSSENAQPEIHVDTYGNKIAITGQSYGDPVHTLLNPTTKTENIATLTQLERTPDNKPYPATNSRSEKPIERTLESHIIPSKIPTKPEDNSIKYDRTFLDVIKAIDAKKTPYKEQNREF